MLCRISVFNAFFAVTNRIGDITALCPFCSGCVLPAISNFSLSKKTILSKKIPKLDFNQGSLFYYLLDDPKTIRNP